MDMSNEEYYQEISHEEYSDKVFPYKQSIINYLTDVAYYPESMILGAGEGLPLFGTHQCCAQDDRFHPYTHSRPDTWVTYDLDLIKEMILSEWEVKRILNTLKSIDSNFEKLFVHAEWIPTPDNLAADLKMRGLPTSLLFSDGSTALLMPASVHMKALKILPPNIHEYEEAGKDDVPGVLEIVEAGSTTGGILVPVGNGPYRIQPHSGLYSTAYLLFRDPSSRQLYKSFYINKCEDDWFYVESKIFFDQLTKPVNPTNSFFRNLRKLFEPIQAALLGQSFATRNLPARFGVSGNHRLTHHKCDSMRGLLRLLNSGNPRIEWPSGFEVFEPI